MKELGGGDVKKKKRVTEGGEEGEGDGEVGSRNRVGSTTGDGGVARQGYAGGGGGVVTGAPYSWKRKRGRPCLSPPAVRHKEVLASETKRAHLLNRREANWLNWPQVSGTFCSYLTCCPHPR